MSPAPTQHWRASTYDGAPDMSAVHPAWAARDAIRRRPLWREVLALRNAFPPLPGVAGSLITAWDRQTDELIAAWHSEHADVMRAPIVEPASLQRSPLALLVFRPA